MIGRLPRSRSVRSGASPRLRQRGVALITAVLIVALATILAIDVTFRSMVDQRRSANLFAFDQGFEVALGAEDYVVKPYYAPLLKARIDACLAAARLRDAPK